MNFAHLEDTIVAIATGEVISAIGIVRLSGKQSFEIVQKIFPSKNLTVLPSHTLHFGKLYGENQQIIDEVVISLFKSPHSYTGEDVIEISCHGNPLILKKVVETCIRLGARLANPGEFTLRAFLNGKLDLTQAEAVADLIHAQSDKAHELALKQLKGGFSQDLKSLRTQLLDLASLLELELDFSEEDVEFANRNELLLILQQIFIKINELKNSFRLGNVIKQGIPTVIAGRPNAGKSSLLNLLLNEERAIVSDIAGTTRDTIEETLNLNGILFQFIDTAGIRKATDTIETIGIQKTFEKIQKASVLIYLFDCQLTNEEQILEDLQSFPLENLYLILVANKLDLNPSFEFNEELNQIASKTLKISCKNKESIDTIKKCLIEYAQNQTISNSTIVTNARHYEALEKCHEALTQALNNMKNQVSSEFIAQDLRQVLYYLGTITGEITNDEILGNIFSKFCIGK